MKIIRPVAVTDAILTSSSIAENDHAAYNGATTYADGDRVISVTTHRIYESLAGSNLGNALPVSPETETAWWLDVGATNRWKMFDSGVATQSSAANIITVVLAPGRVDSVALLNIEADTYQVILTSGGPQVYNSGVVSLVLSDTIGDWYQYFFEEIIRKTDVVVTDIPPYGNGILTVELTAASATVLVGALIVGLYRDIGTLLEKPRAGINDYSKKTADDFGNMVPVERAFSKRLSGVVMVNNSLVDEVVRVLSEYRATAVVWVGTESFTSTIIFGFYKSFDVVIEATVDAATVSMCNLDIEGLV